MKKGDRLFNLIKSLSKSEKRFFKIYSGRHVIGEENKYVQLFNAIDRQKVYKEEYLLKKFANEKFIKRLPVAKSYLYELILRSMNVYHAQNSLDMQLWELLGNIHFLYEKALYGQAEKLLIKTVKLALEHEKLAMMPEILRWQKQIMEARFYANLKEEDILKIYTKSQEIYLQLLNINDYWLLQARLNFHYQHQGESQKMDELNDLIQNSVILKNEAKAESYEAKLLLYKTLSTYYFISRNIPECYQYSKKLVSLLESRPEFIYVNPLLYINSLNNLLNMVSMLGKQEERVHYLSGLDAMRQDKQYKKMEHVQLKLFEVYYYHHINDHVRQAQFKEGLPLIKELEDGLDTHGHNLEPMGEAMLCFYGFHICFGAEKYKEAHLWLQRILQYQASEIRPDIYNFAHILSILSAYELQDEDVWKKTIFSVYRYLYQKDSVYQLESYILRIIKEKLSQKVISRQALLRLFKDIDRQLSIYAQDDFEKRIFVYFHFSNWVQAKIKGKTFADMFE